MFKNLTTIIAGTLIALGTGPAFAQSNNVPMDLDTIIEILDTLQAAADDSQNLLEPKTIFVTSTSFQGDFGGLEAADTICQGLADGPLSIVPAGDYVAVLSTGEVNAIARVTPTSGPYIRPDGAIVAANFAALFSTPEQNPTSNRRDLIHRVNMDAMGGDVADEGVWTGSFANGTGGGGGLHCQTIAGGAWSSNSFDDQGELGLTSRRDEAWLGIGSEDCNLPQRLYCAQL